MSFRTWVSIVTFALLVIVVAAGWNEIVQAWSLLGQVNIEIWLLLIPVQLASYYAVGKIIFSYLHSKGDLQDISKWRMTRIALELNFVNHILPSGGAAGFSYLGWILHKFGVNIGRSTMAQIIRFVLTFVSYVIIVLLSLAYLAIEGKINDVIIIASLSLIVVISVGSVLTIAVISSKRRLQKFSAWLSKTVNKFVEKLTFGRKCRVIKKMVLDNFFKELHHDYLAIRRDKKILKMPMIWSLVANVLDVSLLWIAFMSLGFFVDPALLFIAFGVSSVLSVFAATPGGAGVYEAIMIAFLLSTGITPDIAIAGTLLARVTLLIGTIIFGYLLYQLTINKYGVRPQ